jgi:hypothetical protein
MCVRKLDDSQGFAIRITYRSSLRSSSMWEPRHPLLKGVITSLCRVVRLATNKQADTTIGWIMRHCRLTELMSINPVRRLHSVVSLTNQRGVERGRILDSAGLSTNTQGIRTQQCTQSCHSVEPGIIIATIVEAARR